MSPTIDLARRGPTEQAWSLICDSLPSFVWPECSRLVVASPHPDDETLGAGGLIALAAQRGIPTMILSVTDGEAAAPTVPGLAEVRRAEQVRALQCLASADAISNVRLGLPDGRVAGSLTKLTEEIANRVVRTDLVVCPLEDDGHPDHEATATAALDAAAVSGATVRCFPIWAWHCHDPATSLLSSGERLVLGEEIVSRKRQAVTYYASQLGGLAPVVPPRMLARLLRPFEVLVAPR